MRNRVLVATAGAILIAATACGGSSHGSGGNTAAGPPEHPARLVADVGHNGSFGITLRDPAGKTIRNLAAGTYTLDINDASSIHNFHIFGKGVDDKSDVSRVGKQSFTVSFARGFYAFQCDVHVSQMHGTFEVS